MELSKEVIGEGGPQRQVGKELEDALARHVDLGLCANWAHCERDSSRAPTREGLVSKSTGEGEPPIFDVVSNSPLDDRYERGSFAGAGTYFCLGCGSQLSTEESEALPSCPHCGGARFRRDSIFEAHQDHSGQTVEFGLPHPSEPPAWLVTVRASLARPGHYLALREEGSEIEVFPIERGWTRIGRSVTAEVRLDDPSVSRRHALVVAEPGKNLRVLDDRSLNGVFVNGKAIEWAPLADGDELTIGRYSLYAISR